MTVADVWFFHIIAATLVFEMSSDLAVLIGGFGDSSYKQAQIISFFLVWPIVHPGQI